MTANETDIQFVMKKSRLIGWIRLGLWSAIILLVVIGPFTLIAKTVFVAIWFLFAVYYWQDTLKSQNFTGLRCTQGNVILIFNNDQEPELITLLDEQRILPWLIELHFLRASGQRCTWGITFDAMDANSFRRLKVFINTYH